MQNIARTIIVQRDPRADNEQVGLAVRRSAPSRGPAAAAAAAWTRPAHCTPFPTLFNELFIGDNDCVITTIASK